MNLGLSTQKIVAILLGLQLLLCVLLFVSLQVQGWLSLAILGIAYLSALAFFAAIHFINRKAMIGAEK
jgi:UDP-GlcNAc:undecaprenyl-phosphate GlcNAc-1-phosphate transferase